MNEQPARIAEAIASAAATINSSVTLDETLDAIVEAALRTVPGFDHVGISIAGRDGSIETLAGTDQLVWDLDVLQYSLREGPCYDAIRDTTITVVNDAGQDGRWPRYMPAAAERGLRSQLAVGLYRDEESLGGLNLYSTQADTVQSEAVIVAELFAAHATIALGRAREVSQLNEALSSRKLIGQAVGIVMERYQIDDDRAFQFLIRASQTGNIKLRDIAQELVNETINRIRTRPD